MEAFLCDCCKKVLARDEIKRVNLDYRRIEVCNDCEEKVNKIKQDYDIQYNHLQEKANKIREDFQIKLKNLGIKE